MYDEFMPAEEFLLDDDTEEGTEGDLGEEEESDDETDDEDEEEM